MTRWSSIKLYAVLLFAGLTMAAGVTPAGADTGCSTSAQSLATLASFFPEAGGNGCLQVGTVQFSDWLYSTSGDASLFQASAINVTPGTLSGNAGVTITGGFTTTSNMDVNIQFEVSSVDPNQRFTDAHLQLVAGGVDPVTGGVGVITETIRTGGSDTGACLGPPAVRCLPGGYDIDGTSLGSRMVSIGGSDAASWDFSATPASELVISKDIHIACRNEVPCTVSISNFTQAFSSPVPEPATLLLLGSGLAGAGIFGRRRLTKARA